MLPRIYLRTNKISHNTGRLKKNNEITSNMFGMPSRSHQKFKPSTIGRDKKYKKEREKRKKYSDPEPWTRKFESKGIKCHYVDILLEIVQDWSR